MPSATRKPLRSTVDQPAKIRPFRYKDILALSRSVAIPLCCYCDDLPHPPIGTRSEAVAARGTSNRSIF